MFGGGYAVYNHNGLVVDRGRINPSESFQNTLSPRSTTWVMRGLL